MLVTQISWGIWEENILRGPRKSVVINLDCISIDWTVPESVRSVPQTNLPVSNIIIAPYSELGSCRDNGHPAITYIET